MDSSRFLLLTDDAYKRLLIELSPQDMASLILSEEPSRIVNFYNDTVFCTKRLRKQYPNMQDHKGDILLKKGGARVKMGILLGRDVSLNFVCKLGDIVAINSSLVFIMRDYSSDDIILALDFLFDEPLKFTSPSLEFWGFKYNPELYVKLYTYSGLKNANPAYEPLVDYIISNPSSLSSVIDIAIENKAYSLVVNLLVSLVDNKGSNHLINDVLYTEGLRLGYYQLVRRLCSIHPYVLYRKKNGTTDYIMRYLDKHDSMKLGGLASIDPQIVTKTKEDIPRRLNYSDSQNRSPKELLGFNEVQSINDILYAAEHIKKDVFKHSSLYRKYTYGTGWELLFAFDSSPSFQNLSVRILSVFDRPDLAMAMCYHKLIDKELGTKLIFQTPFPLVLYILLSQSDADPATNNHSLLLDTMSYDELWLDRCEVVQEDGRLDMTVHHKDIVSNLSKKSEYRVVLEQYMEIYDRNLIKKVSHVHKVARK